MSGSRTKFILPTLILSGLATLAFAQNASEPSSSPPRAASFLTEGTPVPVPLSGFSGLASPPELTPPPTPALPTSSSPTAPIDIVGAPVSTAPLANVSPESVGLQTNEGLGVQMWKDTPHSVAEHLLSLVTPSSSPILNILVRRLLTISAAPPEGDAESPQSLVSMRIEKLVAFGDTTSAWALMTRANPKLIDDITFHLVAENEAATDISSLCPQLPAIVQARTSVDWQKDLIICQLNAKDTKAAQVALDVMRTQPKRDDMFLEVADKNVLGDSKTLPRQLTPLSSSMLALLKVSTLPLPGELYGHTDFALTPALLSAPAKEDVAQLGLAERAVQRGIITSDTLATIYKTISFPPEKLSAAVSASESGSRQRALLYQAALAEQDPAKRLSYAVKFVQSTPPDLLNAAGSLLVTMLGSIKADLSLQENAVTVARIYMLANRGDTALDWYRLARSANNTTDDLQSLWPQFTLAGLEADTDFASDLDKWLATTLKASDPPGDMRPAQDNASAVLLFLDAAGFKIPDATWAKVLVKPHNEKHIAFSPTLLDRLQTASLAGRRAETVLLATGVAGESDIPLPVAVAITRALRLVGLKNEAGSFAQQQIALLGKAN
jgi:hypothetical protein